MLSSSSQPEGYGQASGQGRDDSRYGVRIRESLEAANLNELIHLRHMMCRNSHGIDP
ncbi:hypothetical protein [Paenibacillus amylolyticus]|uniref:hypothetical protein n=1 Tax=Paenibacillus amylolyticus TaxID=1451 RepID=UPI00249C331D|nr:hypothetical protein [Paenibacillus amylolyticus]WFA82652.1 hypothetical protein OGI70_16460 [Paenibacillus amylolyticus]